MANKPGIPPQPKQGEDRARFDSAIKESLETIMGRRGGPIKSLDPTTATLDDVIAKLNELLVRVQ